ncbi:MAG: glucose-6-phosphate dehydrogenase, partial [Thermoflexus sp.]
MSDRGAIPPFVLTIFGASGDLAWRKLLPALFDLHADGWLPGRWAVIGLARSPLDDVAFRARARDGVARFARRPAEDSRWSAFAERLSYLQGDYADPAVYAALARRLRAFEAEGPER